MNRYTNIGVFFWPYTIYFYHADVNAIICMDISRGTSTNDHIDN